MQRSIALCVAVALFAGCKGDVTQTSPESADQSSSTSQQNTPATEKSLAQPEGFDSPQAVFAALQQAVEADDFSAAARCLDPESQQAMAVIMTIPLGLVAAFDPEKEKEVEQLFKKYGISMEEDSDEFPIKSSEERIAFMADVVEWMEANGDDTGEDSGPLKKMGRGSLGEVSIEDERATATVTLADNSTEEIEFARVDGQWYLHLSMEPQLSADGTFGSGGGMPFNQSEFGAFGDEEPPPPIEAVPLELFQSAWQLKLNEKDQPARTLLTLLATQLGLELKVDSGIENALRNPVSLEDFKGSPWEAIETIAQQAGVTPVYSTSSIDFEPGQRELPVVFAGPFLIEMKEFETDPQTASGQLSLQVIAAGLPATVAGILNEGIGNPVELTAVTDADTNDLRRNSSAGGIMGFGGMSRTPGTFQREIVVGLKNLLRGVKNIDTLQGRISFSLPTKVEVLKFDDLKSGIEQKTGGATLVLHEINGSSVTVKYSGTDNENIHLQAFDAQGKQIKSFSTSSFGSGDSGQMSVEYESAPARLEARIVTQQEELEYDFKFAEVPIPNQSEMPEKLAELKFEGDAPVSLKFDSITGEENFRDVKFHVTNHANKDAHLLQLSLVYLDEEGKELKKSPVSHGQDKILAGQEADIEVSAFFMPENTKTVNVVLKSVEFTDASEWKAKRK